MASIEKTTPPKTHIENTPQMNNSLNNNNNNNNNSENSNLDNNSQIKFETLTLPCYNSKVPSFSKLLEGVVMAANANLSPQPLVKAVDFKGKLEVSHQEDFVNVTENTSQKGNSSHSDEPPGDVPRTPKSDGYSWRKYGQKQVKGTGSSRSYYRCTYVSCSAKKKVQHVDLSGEVIDVVYKGDHNHDPPQHVRGTIRKKDSAPGVLQNSRDSLVQNRDVPHSLSSDGGLKQLVPQAHDCQVRNLHGAAETSPKDVEEQPSQTVDTVSRPESALTVVPAIEEHSGSRSANSNGLAMIDPMKVPDVAPFKKRRVKERGKACSESVYRTFKAPKVVVLADTDAVMSSDGYRWRKYGQKMVKGTPHPRSYYRCSSVGCPVRKHVERATENSAAILVTYEGEHDHHIPTPKRHHHLASPNPTTSGANMVLEKTESKPSSQISAEEQPKDLVSNLKEDQKASETGGDKVLESARTLLSIGVELKSC